MSTIENISASARSRPSRMARGNVSQLFRRAVRLWQRNRAINELLRLDDRLLDDIGISRNDIPRVVEGLFSAGEAYARPATKDFYPDDASVIVAGSYPRAG